VKRRLVLLGCAGLALVAVSAFMYSTRRPKPAVAETVRECSEPLDFDRGFESSDPGRWTSARGVCGARARATLKLSPARIRSQDSQTLCRIACSRFCQSMV